MSAATPGILLVLDGWGHAPPSDANALTAARTPCLDHLRATCPATLAEASGSAVGLLPSTVGNSEIGHLVIGAGRPIPYDSVLVQEQIDSGGLRSHPVLRATCERLAGSGGSLHLVGLCSDGMIHANIAHLPELLRIAAKAAVPHVHLHVITDGRDVSDHTAAAYLNLIDTYTTEAGIGQVATVMGRGYALDKSGDLTLTQRAAHAIADGEGKRIAHPQDALEPTGRGDEWTPPCVVTGEDARPVGTPRPGDAFLFTNFRSDRIQQLADYLVTHLAGRDITFLSLAQYDTQADIPALVSRSDAGGGLATELSAHGIRSVRIAESEKFEHVTYYLNGRDATPLAVEEHVKIIGDAPPDYRIRPEMNLDRVTRAVTEAAGRPEIPLVVANLANIDVVGHTGHFEATVKAAEHTDAAVLTICEAARSTGRWVLLVGDHGNAEKMLTDAPDGTSVPYGGHTTHPVPAVLVPAPGQSVRDEPHANATLADIAPSVLALLGHPAAPAMTGRALW